MNAPKPEEEPKKKRFTAEDWMLLVVTVVIIMASVAISDALWGDDGMRGWMFGFALSAFIFVIRKFEK